MCFFDRTFWMYKCHVSDRGIPFCKLIFHDKAVTYSLRSSSVLPRLPVFSLLIHLDSIPCDYFPPCFVPVIPPKSELLYKCRNPFGKPKRLTLWITLSPHHISPSFRLGIPFGSRYDSKGNRYCLVKFCVIWRGELDLLHSVSSTRDVITLAANAIGELDLIHNHVQHGFSHPFHHPPPTV